MMRLRKNPGLLSKRCFPKTDLQIFTNLKREVGIDLPSFMG